MSEPTTNLTRKEQVIRKAAELFKDKGYAAASMRDLAQLLGIEAASLYSHIKSKEEILQSLCFDMASEFRKSLEEVEKQNATSIDKLRNGIIAHIQVMAKDLGGIVGSTEVAIPVLSKGQYLVTFYGNGWQSTEKFMIGGS